jgi:hypothetical protein
MNTMNDPMTRRVAPDGPHHAVERAGDPVVAEPLRALAPM